MHHIRGLVRPAANRALKQLEQVGPTHTLKDYFRTVELQDSQGHTCVIQLLHPAALLSAMDRFSDEAAAQTLRAALAVLHDSDSAGAVLDVSPKSEVTALYIKGTAESCRDEIRERERRFVLKLQGRRLAADTNATNEFVAQLLKQSSTDDDHSIYYGLLEALCASDPRAAIAIGVNSKLPPLNATSANCLAQLVDVETPSAITTFLGLVAEKDLHVAAHERCATYLAARVRQAAPQHLDLVIDKAGAALDPGTVFPSTPVRIQSVVLQQVDASVDGEGTAHSSDWSLPARGEAVLALAQAGQWLPRRVAMTSLSAVCLTDLERPWLRHTLAGVPAELPAIAPPTLSADRATPTQRAARALVLKDVRRNLVDNRLLHEYAELLRVGDVSADDGDSFPAFLEECGECHSRRDRPASIEFTLAPFSKGRLAEGSTLRDQLLQLAPGCSYWTTLLRHMPERVSACVAPCGDVRVCVSLPAEHECGEALRLPRFVEALPPALRTPRILWEDAHVMVVDKPSGVATSRHALSTTQTGRAVTDLLSCLVRAEPSMADVFREGQVHRLDTGTSGCILFAKSSVAAASLRHQMGTSAAYSHSSKTYWALCAVLEPDLARVPLKGVLHDRADSKIRTTYRVVRFFSSPRAALVECRLQQGKKHQVRRHLASVGLPLLGDVDHGGAACCHPLLSRVALHARSLSFVHPVTGCTISAVAPVPADMQRAIECFTEKAAS